MGHSVLSVENKGQAESRAALWSNTQQSFAFSPFLQRSAIVHSFTEKKKNQTNNNGSYRVLQGLYSGGFIFSGQWRWSRTL